MYDAVCSKSVNSDRLLHPVFDQYVYFQFSKKNTELKLIKPLGILLPEAKFIHATVVLNDLYFYNSQKASFSIAHSSSWKSLLQKKKTSNWDSPY